MEIGLIALIGIALGAMFFGYFFGLVEGRAQGHKRGKGEKPPDHDSHFLTEKPPAPPALGTAVAEDTSQSRSWLELDGEQNDQPRMHLDGQRIDTAKLTPAQHKRLIELLIMMRPWVEATPHAPEAGAAAEAPSARPLIDRQAAGLPGAGQSAVPSAPPPTSGSAGAAVVPGAGDVGAPSSMVAQIDAILQARLQGTTLGSLGIRLAESLNGGVIVFVGKQSYAGVVDVPDAKVQAAIRGAIAEWERRYTPG